jgi:glycosyltransferase involved in cell wall biosynthesis
MKPRVSFVVPVRNDAVRLETCLRSISRNSQRPGQIEIIVVDNGSTDGSPDVARRFGAFVITATSGRVAELRNLGASHAKADILAFVDADNEIVAGWVYAALACLQIPGVGAAGALYHAPPDGSWVQRAYGKLRGGHDGHHDVDWLGSGNLAVRREAFESIGGFDTSLETCEDVDFCHRLQAHRRRVVSDVRLKSVHHGDPKTLREVFSSERWRGRDNLRVSFRRPFSWNAVPTAIIPVVGNLLIAAAAFGLVAACAGGWPGLFVTSAALAAFAAPAAMRAARSAVQDRRIQPVSLLQTFVVACVYDVGRALALVSRTPHRAVRQSAATATS